MNTIWQINLLGCLMAQREDRVVRRFQTSKAGALLACLAYDLKQDHSRDVLIERIWPETDLYAGRHCLSQTLYSLRLQLEPPGVSAGSVVVANHAHVRLNPSAVTTDVDVFITTVKTAEATDDPVARVDLLNRAVEIYQGELLPGYFEDWVLVERERLTAVLLRCLRQVVTAFESMGETDRALECALRALRA